MKKVKYLIMLFVAAFIFAPCINVFAEPTDSKVIDEIRLYSNKPSVALNEALTEFNAYSKTEGITVEAYGENTSWAMTYKENDWTKVADGTLAKDTDAHYGLRLNLTKEDNYEFGSNLKIYYNGEEISGYSLFNIQEGWVVYVDLGTPTSGSTPDPEEPEEPAYYKAYFDLNGAKWADEHVEEEYSQGVDVEGGKGEVSCPPTYVLTPPKLKVFDGWEINGVRYAPGEECEITSNVTIKFLWKDTDEEVKDYTVENDDFGITIEFTEVAGKDFELYVETLSQMTDEYIEENWEDPEKQAEIKEEVRIIKESLIDKTKKYGTYIDLYMIYVDEDQDGSYHEGPFKIKIKMTEAMKKYNTFKMVYIKDFDEDGVDVSDEVIELTVNGDYLEGTLEHLSNYALLGSIEEESPKTGDNVIIYIILGILSGVGLVSVRKLRNNN